jgi:hypothetical protein
MNSTPSSTEAERLRTMFSEGLSRGEAEAKISEMLR